MKFQRQAQQGIGALTVVIILVMLAALGAFMATFSGVAHISTALSQRTMQAWFAAQTGVDWAVYDAIQNAAGNLNCGGAAVPAVCSVADGTVSFTLTGGETNGYEVIIRCTQNTFNEAGTSYDVFILRTTACRGALGDPVFVSRTVRAKVTNAP